VGPKTIIAKVQVARHNHESASSASPCLVIVDSSHNCIVSQVDQLARAFFQSLSRMNKSSAGKMSERCSPYDLCSLCNVNFVLVPSEKNSHTRKYGRLFPYLPSI
jgi:hypothetical protein